MSQQASSTDTEAQSAMPAVPRSSVWGRVLLGVSILVCGIAIGAGGAIVITRNMPRSKILEAVRHRERVPALMTKRMQKELHLSPEQAKQVEDIVTQRFRAIWEIREESRPRGDKQLNLMKEQVAEVLDEAQAREWRERFERLLRPPGPPRGRHRPGPRGPRRPRTDGQSSAPSTDAMP